MNVTVVSHLEAEEDLVEMKKNNCRKKRLELLFLSKGTGKLAKHHLAKHTAFMCVVQGVIFSFCPVWR